MQYADTLNQCKIYLVIYLTIFFSITLLHLFVLFLLEILIRELFYFFVTILVSFNFIYKSHAKFYEMYS